MTPRRWSSIATRSPPCRSGPEARRKDARRPATTGRRRPTRPSSRDPPSLPGYGHPICFGRYSESLRNEVAADGRYHMLEGWVPLSEEDAAKTTDEEIKTRTTGFAAVTESAWGVRLHCRVRRHLCPDQRSHGRLHRPQLLGRRGDGATSTCRTNSPSRKRWPSSSSPCDPSSSRWPLKHPDRLRCAAQITQVEDSMVAAVPVPDGKRCC